MVKQNLICKWLIICHNYQKTNYDNSLDDLQLSNKTFEFWIFPHLIRPRFVQCTCNSHVHFWRSRDQRNLMNVNQISLSGIRRFPWHSLAVDDPLILQSKLLFLVPTHLPLYNVNRQKGTSDSTSSGFMTCTNMLQCLIFTIYSCVMYQRNYSFRIFS